MGACFLVEIKLKTKDDELHLLYAGHFEPSGWPELGAKYLAKICHQIRQNPQQIVTGNSYYLFKST